MKHNIPYGTLGVVLISAINGFLFRDVCGIYYHESRSDSGLPKIS